MTDKQPKALRLARELECVYPVNIRDQEAAASELRRLWAANIDCVAWYEDAKAQRDELLKALEFFLKWGRCQKAEDMARAAVAKTESAS